MKYYENLQSTIWRSNNAEILFSQQYGDLIMLKYYKILQSTI